MGNGQKANRNNGRLIPMMMIWMPLDSIQIKVIIKQNDAIHNDQEVPLLDRTKAEKEEEDMIAGHHTIPDVCPEIPRWMHDRMRDPVHSHFECPGGHS